MKSDLSLVGLVVLFGAALVQPGWAEEEMSFPCTKLAEILPDAALNFAREYFAWKNPDKINVHLEYTAAALFEEFYAIEGVNKAASPDSFYRAIEDIVFTPFDYDAERTANIENTAETETNYYLSRCIALTKKNEFHYARIMLSGIIRHEFKEMGVQATNREFSAKIRSVLNTIYYHLAVDDTTTADIDEQEIGVGQFERLCGLKPGTVFAVVIDTTESMAIEIEAVKKEVKKIVRTTQNTPDEPLEYLLVPYNDPFTESGIIRHTNAESFINDVDNLEATGGDDTPEPLVEAMHAATIRCPPRSTIFVFTDAPDKNNDKLEEVLAMIIAKRIEVNIYLTEPSLSVWDSSEHSDLAKISGGMIYKITKDTASIEAAAEYLQTSAEDSKSFLYIGDNMSTDQVTLTVDSAIRSISIFAYGESRNINSISVVNTVAAPAGAKKFFDETNGNRMVYKSNDKMNFAQADVFCKDNVGGRLVLLKDKAYRDQFHNLMRGGQKGWIGIKRTEGSHTYEWSDGKTVFPSFNGFLALGKTRSCGSYDSAIRDVYSFDASWFNEDCEELHHAYCERVEAQVQAEIELEKFKLYRITSILPGEYTLKFDGTINAEKTFNLRVWGATYMSLGSKLFPENNNDWFNNPSDDSRLTRLTYKQAVAGHFSLFGGTNTRVTKIDFVDIYGNVITDDLRTYSYETDGEDPAEVFEPALCFPDKSIYHVPVMYVPQVEFRVRMTGFDKQNNLFVRLDPGVYSPVTLEVQMSKIYDLIMVPEATKTFKASEESIFILNEDREAARYALSAFCEDSRVSIRAWGQDADIADDGSKTWMDLDNENNKDSMYCQSSADQPELENKGYEKAGPCYYNMEIKTAVDAVSTTCYLVNAGQQDFVFSTFDVIVLAEPKECPVPIAPANGSIKCNGFTTGAECSYTCNAGYALKGDEKRNCLISGSWDVDAPKCQKVQLAKCHGSGDPHYTTFDGYRFDFMGTCQYTYANFEGTYAGVYGTGTPWRVTVENAHRNGNQRVSYLKVARLYITLGGTAYEFALSEKKKLHVNGVEMFTPYTLGDDIMIERAGRITTIKMTKADFVITYKRGVIDLELGDRYKGVVDGLCGNFDGDKDNDHVDAVTGAKLKMAEHGNRHVFGDATGNTGCAVPEYEPRAEKFYDDKCQCGAFKITDNVANAESPFAACLAKSVDNELIKGMWDNLYKECNMDAVEMDSDEQRAEIFETALGNAFAVCNKLFANEIDFTDWRGVCFPNSKERQCPPNSHYNFCGSACPLTCSDKPGVPKFCTRQCVEQCECDSGFVLSGDKCVPLRECGCTDEKFGGYFQLGHKFQTKDCLNRKKYECKTPFAQLEEIDLGDCPNKTICKDGECVPDSIGFCRGKGDPHYKTFDGKKYDFMGLCLNRFITVTREKMLDQKPSVPPFEIRTRHRNAWAPRNTKVAMTEWVWIDIYSRAQMPDSSCVTADGVAVNCDWGDSPKWTIEMRIVDSPADNVGKQRGRGRPKKCAFIVHDNDLDKAFESPEVKNTDFHVVQLAKNMIEVKTWFGVKMSFGSHAWDVSAHVPSPYMELTEGLCGNFNGKPEDDYTGSDNVLYTQKQVVEWAHTWRHPDDTVCTKQGELVEKCERTGNEPVYEACEKMTEDDGPFKVCLPTAADKLVSVNPETALNECIFDYCIETTKEMLCSMYQTYADECMLELVKQNKFDFENLPSVCDWASDPRYDCAPTCEDPNAEYRGCVDTCRDVRTCATKDDNLDAECPAPDSLTAMCVCKDGFVLQGGRCIKADDCGCNIPGPAGPTGIWIPNGFRFMTPDCLEIQTCKDNIYTVAPGTYGNDKNHCNDVTEQCVADPFDKRQGFCEKVEIPQGARFCTIISNAYMSDFENDWINYWTECPTVILNSWRGLSVERHHYEYRVISNSATGKHTVQFDAWNSRWSVNGVHVRSPSSYIRGMGDVKKQTDHHLHFTKTVPSFEDLKAAISKEYADIEILKERNDEELFNFHIFRTSSYEILFIPDYELALMIDQTHDIVKLAIPAESLDFTGGVCMAGMFKPDLEKASSTSEFFIAWAAEADEVETQILSTKDDCGEEKQIEVPIVPRDPCESYAFTNADYIGEAKVLYGTHCDFLINKNGPFAKCFQLVNPFPYYQACISDLGRSKNFDHREFFGQAYSEECAYSNFHVDLWRDQLNEAMIKDFLGQMNSFTDEEENVGNEELVVEYKKANVMVFLVESIYEQMKLLLTLISGSNDGRVKIIETDLEPFRDALQQILDNLLDSEPTNDVKGIYYSVFYQFFDFFDSIKFYNFKYTSIFDVVFEASWDQEKENLDVPKIVSCFSNPEDYINDNMPDNIFEDMETYIKTQVIDLNKDFCDVMDEVDSISRARYDMNYFDLWLQGETSHGKLYVNDNPYGNPLDDNNADKVKALSFFHYIDVFMQLKSKKAKFCTVSISNEANFRAKFAASVTSKTFDIRSYLLQTEGEEDLLEEVITWLAAGRFNKQKYDDKFVEINTQLTAKIATITGEPDMCEIMDEFVVQILTEFDQMFKIFYFIEVLRNEGSIETTPREEIVIQRIIDMIITALFYTDSSSCDIMSVRYGENWRIRVELKFKAIVTHYKDFNWDKDSNNDRALMIINRVIMMWLGDLSQSVDWYGNQCLTDCSEPEVWPDTPSPKSPKTKTGKWKKTGKSKKSKSPKSKKGKSKKGKSKKKKSKTGKWKSGKWKSGTPKSAKGHKSYKKTPKSPKKHGRKHTHSGSSSKSGSYSGSSGRRRRAVDDEFNNELIEEPTVDRHRRSSSSSSGSSGSSGNWKAKQHKKHKKKGKRPGSHPKTRSPKTKRPKTKSPKYKTPTPVIASPEPNWNIPRCGVVGIWCRVIAGADNAISTNGYFTCNQYEDELYFFNPRQDYDVEKTLITQKDGKFIFSFGADSNLPNKVGTLSGDKSSIDFGNGETWYRRGSEQCNKRKQTGHINIPNIRERDCGSEYKYKWTTVEKAFFRLRKWFPEDKPARLNIMKAQFKIMWDNFNADPNNFSFCTDFDVAIRNMFTVPTVSVRYIYREPLERTNDFFGLSWREFMSRFYKVNIEKQTLQTGKDFGTIVQDDFKAFYLNRKSFNQRVTENMAALGIYRPNKINVNWYFNTQIRLLRKRFDLGLPFCEVMDSTYRELNLLTTEKTDRFTDSIENFQNTIRYYTEEFLIDLFNRDNDVCAVRDDALFEYGIDADKFNGYMKNGLDLAVESFKGNDVEALATKLFDDLQFSSLATADDKINLDIKGLFEAALGNIALGTNNFDFILDNTDARDAFNTDFYDNFLATLTSMSSIFGTNDANLCTDLKKSFGDFVTKTAVFPLGFCDTKWPQDQCGKFNVLIEKYNALKLKYDLFQDESVAEIAYKFDAKIKIQDAGASEDQKLSDKQKQLLLAREMKTAVVKHFNTMRIRVEPVEIIKNSADRDAILTKMNDFKSGISDLKAVFEADTTTYDQTGEGFILANTLLAEVDGFISGATAAAPARKRRSFEELSVTDPADRATLRQHVPLFGQPDCGENAVFSDHAHHGKWQMDKSKFFKENFAGDSNVLEYGNNEFKENLGLWNDVSVPAIKYFAGIRFPGCSCPHGQMYFDGVCGEKINGCKFTHDGKDIFMRFNERYHYDCHTEFYCKEDGTYLQRDIDCPDEFCRLDSRTGNTYCEYLGFQPCLENGYLMVALPVFTASSHSTSVSFKKIHDSYSHSEAFRFSLLYLGRDDADAVVVKETDRDEISEWYADYNTDDIINLLIAAEAAFGNSMAKKQVLYMQIDASILVKFNDQIITIMNRLKQNGVSIMLGEVNEIPLIFKSMIPFEESFNVDFTNEDKLATVAKRFCSVNECDFNNGGCSHECRSNMYQRAVCLCPTGYILDVKTCIPTDVTCEITSNMERSYVQWQNDLEEWENM